MAKPIRSSAALAHWQKPIRSDITGSGITIQSPFALTTGHRPWHNSKSPSALTTGHRLWHNGKKTIRSITYDFLKNDLENGQSEMLLVKEIPLNDNFYFDQDHLYFLYNQYEITAYAAGPVLIKVPFSAIQTILKSEFKKRLGI